MSEFVQFFRPKIQGLFKDFLGSYLEISKRSSLESLYLTEPGGGQRLVDFSYLNHGRKYDVTSGEKILLRSSELGSVLARRSAMS